METLMAYLDYTIGGNTVYELMIAFLVFLLLYLFFRGFETIVVVRLRKIAKSTDNDFDDELISVLDNVDKWFYVVLSLCVALKRLVLPEMWYKVVGGLLIVAVVYEVIKALSNLIEYALVKRGSVGRDAGGQAAFHGLNMLIKVALWATGLLLILSNLGFNISSLVASLGIGGIAVALAIQNILGDMFSSFSIYFDKPFKVGDYIVVGTDEGTVKKIGLKTTRLQTLRGEELVISNNELTSARINNLKKLKNRRIATTIGVTYDTTSAKLKKVNEIIEKAIKKEKSTEFVRCYFEEFGDFSLKFGFVYNVNSPDYEEYLKAQQNINFAIKDAFQKAKIEMAFPSQTVYLEK